MSAGNTNQSAGLDNSEPHNTGALRASDGKSLSEAQAKVTFNPPGGDGSDGGGADDSVNGGCGCRLLSAQTRATELTGGVFWVALAGLYRHRRRRVLR